MAALAFTESEAEAVGQQAQTARSRAAATGQAYKPKFFTAAEFATVVALADMIIPKDERSGSASEAGAPEFIDSHRRRCRHERQVAMRGGLVWLDTECRRRFDKAFLGCADAERRQVLDDIAYPAKADPRFSHGVRFFTRDARPGRRRVLVEQDRRQGPRLQGQRPDAVGRRAAGRCSTSSA